jgi:16S rRNA (guanine1207-N2)-methyltransferase
MMDHTLATRDRANRLFDAYGSLLTAQQRQLLRRYYQDDLSLGEIAAQMGVSRQAVHDGLRRALAALERYEAGLGLVAAEHYSTASPRSRLRTRRFTARLRGRTWTFETSSGVFAQHGLDPGTRLLIETMRVGRRDRVLDLGCGYGPAGLVAAALAPQGQAWLVDTNQRAAVLAAANARGNRLTNVRVLVGDAASAVREGGMDVVVTNPPIRAGRRVVLSFIDGAWRALRPGGRFYLVARTAQGAQTLSRLIAGRFGAVQQLAASGGYRVFEGTRPAASVKGPRAAQARPAQAPAGRVTAAQEAARV